MVAPYAPMGRCPEPHLGAARKIEAIVSLLSRKDSEVVLVNTAHNPQVLQSFKTEISSIAGINVRELTLPCFSNRKLGKLFNLFHVGQAIEAVLNLGVPRLVWLYNGYAFESLFARRLLKSLTCPVALEFEDWHFSRGRGLNPKPYLNWLAWRSMMPGISHAFAVNAALASRLKPFTDRISLLPGIVPTLLVSMARDALPFQGLAGEVTVGYFGGLSREKGADLLLALAAGLPAGFRFEVTGGGELETRFVQLAGAQPERFRYHGKVGDQELYSIMSRCDVILNPHRSIASMENGIFPFKVIEAIASGRLLISTAVPGEGFEPVLQGVQFVEHSSNAFRRALLSARAVYEETCDNVAAGAREANLRFGEAAFLARMEHILGHKVYGA